MPHTATQLLQDWRNGDQGALEELLTLVYKELHKRAKHFMRQPYAGQTLQATALINEVYLRLVDSRQVDWESRNHFFAICAQKMRWILVDAAKKRDAQRHGGGWERATFDKALLVGTQQSADIIALDDALRTLSELNPRQCQVVELRYFGGLTIEETASVLQVSPETVKRDWRVAKVWLLRELSRGGQ